MKKFLSKILGFSPDKETDQQADVELPVWSFGESIDPKPYLLDGWLVGKGGQRNLSDEIAFGWDPYFKLSMDTDKVVPEKYASWSIGKQANICLPGQNHDGELAVVLELGAFLDESGQGFQKVNAFVGGEKICSWRVDSTKPLKKLLVVPSSLVQKHQTLQIVIETPDAQMNVESKGTVPEGHELGVELHSVTIFDGLSGYFAYLQSKYDEACAYRNELFEMEGQELQDRGELVDIVKNVLNILADSEEDFSRVQAKLRSFLKDPYVQSGDDERLIFDELYYAKKKNEIEEGVVDSKISKWRAELNNFKEAVLDAGNYVFRKESTEHEASSEILETFLQETKLPKEKIQELKDKNEFVNNLEILLQKKELQSIPPFLEIEMTSFCNFRCVMCSRSMMKFLHAQQNDQQILEISKILPYVKHVTIAGVGEPCSSNKLDVLSRVLKLFQCNVLMFTNGSLLDRQIEAASRLDTVNISFDGPNDKIMAAQRRNSKFKTIVENIKKLRANAPKLKIGFSVVVSRINVDEVAAIVKVAGEIGVNDVNLSPVVNISLLELKKSDQTLYEEQLQIAKEVGSQSGVTVHNNVHPS